MSGVGQRAEGFGGGLWKHGDPRDKVTRKRAWAHSSQTWTGG